VITAAWKEIDAELARREARKAEIVPPIPADLLALYERLRTTKEGVAVGRLADGQCGGCHLHLSAAEQAEAAAADPPRCTHCRRILVL
jgi:predicted  nucleic acid-binding Zn-ribbon protein